MTTIVSCQIRHRVSFSANPQTHWSGTPYIVETRLVRNLPEFPPKVGDIFFDDVVETVVRLPDGTTETLYSEPVNVEVFHVIWDEALSKKVLENKPLFEVPIHAGLQGKVWVIASLSCQLAEQKAD